MDDIDAAFDDAFRTHRIEAGDDPSTLPNPYARPALGGPSSTTAAGSNSTDTDGGFIADDSDAGGGGFIVDDDDRGGGGFIPDDDNSAAGGGFVPEDEDEASRSQPSDITRPATIPLSAIPEALANLGLDSSDPSVLSLFAETAYAPSSSRRRLAPGVKVEKVVGRQQFQQVASILVEEAQTQSSSKGKKRKPRNEDEERASSSRRPTRRAAVTGRQKAADIIGEEDGGGGFVVDADDSEDDFEASSSRRRRRTGAALDTGSDLSSEPEDDVDLSSSRRRRRPGRAAQPSPSPSPSPSAEEDTPKRQRRARKSPTAPSIRSTTHLNPLQRSNASTLFTLLLDRLPPSTFPATQRRIGTTELTTILASLGETLPAKEIEEMVEEAAKLFAPASDDGTGERKSAQAVKGAAAAQGIGGASVGLDEFAGVLVHNRLL
ncbi:EF-hand domain pair [Kalmanozyma brasiliensis GHG001]|uniref:EF-hand domain pair n=1 Tax=Kalmanozyma brasiliensis (strain GHG001) TaxID=1365824 RepID=UPI002867F7AA|nr:EF-hand domain pair [Kalmanozyma brasiliensis GHG001]EST06391.2 EF-hand domain pair [Kalmanozyma brasiliensis GHG001]